MTTRHCYTPNIYSCWPNGFREDFDSFFFHLIIQSTETLGLRGRTSLDPMILIGRIYVVFPIISLFMGVISCHSNQSSDLSALKPYAAFPPALGEIDQN